MAFQNDRPFADFLRQTARATPLKESAPAVNFLLEERLPATREHDFLAALPGQPVTEWDVSSWNATFGKHYVDKVALPLRRASAISTFSTANTSNHIVQESNQDVVRLESLRALHQRHPGSFDSPADLAAELRSLIHSREPGQAGTFSDEQRSRLALWLADLNPCREARPAFAAPFGEMERELAAPDWPARVRDALGLAHFAGSSGKPLPVVLCRYSLSRVERAARKARLAAWAAVPTVLEAGNISGPGATFFPFPKAAAGINPFGFGVTVNLGADGGLDYKSEMLHFRLDYELSDFAMVGEITDAVSDMQVAAARQRHFDLLEQEFQYRADVP